MIAIEPWSAALLEALAGASVRALILAGMAVLALRWRRGLTAPVAHALWAVVTMAMLLLPLGSLLPPVVPLPAAVDLSRWVRMPEKSAPAAAGLGTAVLAQRLAPMVMEIDSRGGWQVKAVGPRVVWGWWSVAGAVYLAGLLVMLGRLAVGSILAGRLVGRSARVREERMGEALEAVAREQGAPMPWPEVLESAEVTAPVVVGRRAPAILLPDGWREWDDWKLRAVLAHELAHVRRGDGRSVVLAAWNRAVFWFHPLAWWLERRLASLCEQACDDAAVRTVGDAPRYAQVLWDIAAAGPGLRIGTAQSMAGASPVGRRIERLLEGGTRSTGLAPWRFWVWIVLGTLPVVVFLAMAQARGAIVDPGDVRPDWHWYQDGFRTSAEEARELEREVAREAGALGARARLVAYYCYNADFEALGTHVLWVIANHPESELAGTGPVMMWSLTGLGGPGEMERLAEKARQLWKEQVARHGGEVRVLGHAAAALHWAEPAESERLLLRARALDGENSHWVGRLAALYSEVIAVDFHRRAGVGSMGSPMRLDYGLGERVRRELAGGTDLEMAGRVGTALAMRLVQTREWKLGQEGAMREARRAMGEYTVGLLERASGSDAVRWAPPLAELRRWLGRAGAERRPG